MKPYKLLLVAALLTAFIPVQAPWFSGKIVYQITAKELSGEDISDKISEQMGSLNSYYISGNSYRLYADGSRPLMLYTGRNNQLQVFAADQTPRTIDANKGRQDAVVKRLPGTATIAGYACQSLEISYDQLGIKTVYFYAPKLRVDPAGFAQNKTSEFITFLKATNGALPLRITTTNPSMVVTQEATAVQPMALTEADFTLEAKPR